MDGIGLLLGLAPVAALGGAGAGGPGASKSELGSAKRKIRPVDVLAAVNAHAAADPELVLRFGMNVPISAGGGTALLNVFQVDVTNISSISS